MGEREEAARAVVASHLGLPVTVQDDGSEPGMYDLRIELGDDRFAAVEVTAAERKDLAATQGAISKKPILNCPQLEHGWLIVLAEGAVVNTARRELPLVLEDLERAGIFELSVLRTEEHEEWAADRLRDAHVQTARMADFLEPGFVGLTGPMRVEWLSLDPEDVATFVEGFAARRPSDVAKLVASGADERHLFVWSGVFSEGMVQLRPLGLDVDALPKRAPELPDGVTHVWVANEGARPSRIVYYAPDLGWVQAGVVNDGAGSSKPRPSPRSAALQVPMV